MTIVIIEFSKYKTDKFPNAILNGSLENSNCETLSILHFTSMIINKY